MFNHLSCHIVGWRKIIQKWFGVKLCAILLLILIYIYIDEQFYISIIICNKSSRFFLKK